MSPFFANQVFHVGNPVLEVSLNISCMYWCYYCTDFQYWKYCLSVLLQCVNPLHPSISMHILHTVLFTFPKALSRRICLTIKSFFSWWSYPLFSRLSCTIQGWYCMEKLDASPSYGLKGLWLFTSFVWSACTYSACFLTKWGPWCKIRQ